jgi:hypothetical protein
LRRRGSDSGNASLKADASPGDAGPPSPSEALLDAAIEHTFPASDPVSVATAYQARERRRSGDGRATGSRRR